MYISLFFTATFSFFILIVLISYKFKEILLNHASKILIGIFMLAYFSILRWVPNIKDFINNENPSSISISRTFLLDLCPAMFVALSLVLVFDFKNKLLPYFSVAAFICGFITYIFVPITESYVVKDSSSLLDYKYLFIGTDANKMYFMMHYQLMLFGFIYFILTPKFKLITLFNISTGLFIYMLYVIFISRLYNVTQNATGLVEFDWSEYGEYSVLGSKFGNNIWLNSFIYIIVFSILCLLIRISIYPIIFTKKSILLKKELKKI
ncbi:Uncharacterised protein [Mycoplasmopsis maculosa]|uniref:Integral membrane protein (Intg_mem_TP0381) n=1 Tax=Mycoplasmopsis maculosa TaxID=114885 RepID=A0A449B4I5_9BACT|nr:DUF5378 family protein [Mycoplasmopsis maculosa]VEU75448.1 Uncharacterised protein [Mycoplasmopsis maculosa]